MCSCCCATGPFAKMYSHSVGISRLITRPARSFWRAGERAQGGRWRKGISRVESRTCMRYHERRDYPELLIGVYPSTLLFGERASMRARISCASENCRISPHSGGNGNRVRRTPLRTDPALHHLLLFFLFPSLSFVRFPLLTETPTLLHVYVAPRPCVLERWPRITVRECRRRPVRHFAWAARSRIMQRERERESALLSMLLRIIYLSSYDDQYRLASRIIVFED